MAADCRVLGHEINNWLTPIRSIADRLQNCWGVRHSDAALGEDLDRGLGVIASASEGLSVSSRRTRGWRAVATLAATCTLPTGPADRGHQTWMTVEVFPCPGVVLRATAISWTRRSSTRSRTAALAAACGCDGAPPIGPSPPWLWRTTGPASPIPRTSFVPFFYDQAGRDRHRTWFLSRQIAEAHGGSLALANRVGLRGCEARLTMGRGTWDVGQGTRCSIFRPKSHVPCPMSHVPCPTSHFTFSPLLRKSLYPCAS